MNFMDTLQFGCFLTLLNLGWVKTSNVSCHSQCVCPSKSTVDCSNKGLRSVPANLPANLSLLLLNHNQLQSLSPQILSSLPSLKELNISDNLINCSCSLSWIRNGSINFRVFGDCYYPPSLNGRAIEDLTIQEMCDIRLTTTASPVVKTVGETVNLNCEPSLPANVRWSRKTVANPQLQDVQHLARRFRVLQNGTLVIGKLEKMDQGEYICLAEHEYGARGNKSVSLTVRPICKINATSVSNMPTLKPTKSYYVAKDVLNLSCTDGYVLNGSSTLTCLPNGSWDSKVFPTCQAICKINATSMSNMPIAKPTKSYYNANDVVSLSCTVGYVLTGSSNLTCLEDGTWDSQVFPMCQATCNIDAMSLSSTITVKPKKTYYVADDEINLSCSSGYILNGSSILKCLADGTWNPKVFPTCQEITSPSTPVAMTTDQTGSVISTTPEVPLNLMKLIKQSNGTQLTPELLKDSLRKFEIGVYRQTSRERKEAGHFLNLASNLMGKQNHAAWSKTEQNFSGVERLLRAVNEAVKLRASEMLQNFSNGTENFSATFDNLDAEIQVGAGDVMAKRRIKFPSKGSPQDDHIEFPAPVFESAGKQQVAVVGIRFKELGELLPQRSFITNLGKYQTNPRVLSGSVITLSGNLSGPVTIAFKNTDISDIGKESAKCVFWKYDKTVKNFNRNTYREAVNVSQGGWSDKGCYVLSRNASSTVCRCNHLTDFAVLIPEDQEIVKPSVFVYAGNIFLLIAVLIAFIRNIVVWRQTRRERLPVLINECLAIILFVAMFLVGVSLDYDKAMCVTVAILMHWFVLSVFSWILVEEIQLYLSVQFGWSRDSTRFKYFLVLGWLIPLIVVGVALAVTRLDGYGSPQWCWYDHSLTLLLSYVCPVALCIMVSLVVILKIVFLKAMFTDAADKKDVSVILALSGLLIPLVAVTWVCAALSADQPEKDMFQYLFAVFCIVLGIYILLYHCWLDREVSKVSFKSNKRTRPKRDYYSTKTTVMYSEGTSEGKSFSLIFPSRKSPTHGKKSSKGDTKRSNKRSDSGSPFDYDSSLPLYPSINDSSLKSFRSQVSTQQHTLESPPNTLSAIKISRPSSQSIELTSLSDLDRGNERPDGAEQNDSGERREFYSPRNSSPVEKVRERTSSSSDYQCATTFGIDNDRPIHSSSDKPNGITDEKNRISGTSSAGISRTSRSSISGASLGAVEESEASQNEDAYEKEPFLHSGNDRGPEVRSDPPTKIPKRRKKGSRRRLDGDVQEEEAVEPKIRQKSSSLPHTDENVELKQYKNF